MLLSPYYDTDILKTVFSCRLVRKIYIKHKKCNLLFTAFERMRTKNIDYYKSFYVHYYIRFISSFSLFIRSYH